MQYVVIEYFGEPTLVKDEEGKVKMFDNTSDAHDEARECNNGIVVPLAQTLTADIAAGANKLWELTSKESEDQDELEGLFRLLGEEQVDD